MGLSIPFLGCQMFRTIDSACLWSQHLGNRGRRFGSSRSSSATDEWDARLGYSRPFLKTAIKMIGRDANDCLSWKLKYHSSLLHIPDKNKLAQSCLPIYTLKWVRLFVIESHLLISSIGFTHAPWAEAQCNCFVFCMMSSNISHDFERPPLYLLLRVLRQEVGQCLQ